MASKSGKLDPGAGPSTRGLALAALLVAICLLAWRGSVLLTADTPLPATATPLEASLMNIISPVAGAGNARVSVNTAADGARTVLVLLDASASDTASAIESLVTTAARLDVAAGDLLVLQKAEFARGAPGRPDARAWGELSLLGLLAGLLGWLALAPQAEAAPERTYHTPAPPVTAPSPPRSATPVRTLAAPAPPGDAADLARKDPARAADILRGWMANRTDAA